jgi:hypothetical protein
VIADIGDAYLPVLDNQPGLMGFIGGNLFDALAFGSDRAGGSVREVLVFK